MKAKTMCECLTISQAALFKRLTTTSLNHLTQHMPLYPQKAVVEKQILNRNIWDNYKKQLINDILLQSSETGSNSLETAALCPIVQIGPFDRTKIHKQKRQRLRKGDCSWVKPERVRAV